MIFFAKQKNHGPSPALQGEWVVSLTLLECHHMSTAKIATSTFWQVLSQALMAVLSIITVKCVAVGLSRELAGTYNSAYGYLQLFGILADFGLYAVAIRELTKKEGRAERFGALMMIRCMTIVVSLGCALLIAWVNPAWRSTLFPMAVLCAVAVPLFTLLAGMLRAIFQVEYRMHFVCIAEVSQRVLTVGLIGMLIVLGVRQSNDPTMLYAFLLFGGAGALLLFLASLVYARRLTTLSLRFDRALVLRLFLRAAPFGLAYLCMGLYRQTDVLLIAVLRPDFALQNAHYGFALRSSDMAFLLPTFLLNSTLPLLSERVESGQDVQSFVGKILFAILLIGATAGLFAFLWARPIMQLLTTDAYLSTAIAPGADTALSLLALPMFLNGIILFGFYVMLTRHAWRPLVGTLAIGATFSLLFSMQLIPTFGFVGAGVTSIVIHILLAFLLLAQSLRVLPVRLPATIALQWVGYVLLLGAFLFIVRPLLDSPLATIAGLAASTFAIACIAWALRIHRSLRVA